MTLRYARENEGFGFHVDVVPAKALVGRLVPVDWPTVKVPWPVDRAPLEVPMRKREQWRGTAPLEYTQFCFDAGADVRRTVRELKRWRDEHEIEIKSIVLQVLIATAHPGNGLSDAEAIVGTLEKLSSRLVGLDRPPEIRNPVLPSENLADRWRPADFVRFTEQLAEAANLAAQARASLDEAESHELWIDLLGDDFPPYSGGGHSVPPVPPPRHRSAPQQPQRRVVGA